MHLDSQPIVYLLCTCVLCTCAFLPYELLTPSHCVPVTGKLRTHWSSIYNMEGVFKGLFKTSFNPSHVTSLFTRGLLLITNL